MNSDTQHDDLTRAAEWHVKLRCGDDEIWADFAVWLAEDPAHVAAYDVVEGADADLDVLLPQISFGEAAADELPLPAVPRRRRHYWGYGVTAFAASVVVAVALVPHFGDRRYEIETKRGESRTIVLNDTTQVTLNGATRMTFDRRDTRFAALISGEALFRVRHDDKRPFSVEIGRNRITDVGTVFDVVNDAHALRVAVAEGAVRYEARSAAVLLRAGQSLVGRANSGVVRVTAVSPATVGSWTQGRLTYSGEELHVVAADLARSLGIDIDVSPAIRRRPFTGTLVVERGDPGQLQRLAEALDVRLTRTSGGVSMEPGRGGAP